MEKKEFAEIARRIRIETVKSLYAAQSGHPGSSLSTIDVLTALYFKPILRYDSNNPDWDKRDYFLLSNGHAAPGFYATLAVAGFYPVEQLNGLRKFGTPMHGHPKRGTFPGVEISSGSLGMGLSIGVGLALALKLQRKKNNVFVMMSDGEQEEGSTWEAIMFAPKRGLDNLVAIVDDNKSQINGPSREIMPALFPLRKKYEVFGWEAVEIDGNNMGEVLDAFEKAQRAKRPFVIIANTVIGKGVSFMEGDYRWHHGKLSDQQYKTAMKDLGANSKS